MGLLVLASEPFPRKKLSTFEGWSAVFIKTPTVDCGEVWERGFGVRRVLGGKVLVYDVDVFEGCHTSATGTMVSQVHLLFGIHLMSLLPVSYQCTEAVNPLQGDDTRMGLELRQDYRSYNKKLKG